MRWVIFVGLVASVGLVAVGCGGSSPEAPLKAGPPPYRFAVVSGSGAQEATSIQTQERRCRRRRNEIHCSFGSLTWVPARKLSVVRPGEVIQFKPNLELRGPLGDAPHTSITVTPLCSGVPTVGTGDFRGGEWRVNVPPGAYTVSIDFPWQFRARNGVAGGTVGLLVSETAPRGITKAPRC